MYVYRLHVFLLSSFDRFFSELSRSCFFSQITHVLPIRTWHRQQAHSTAQANQLCTSSSWHYQIDSFTKSWASYFCPLHSWMCYSLRERSRRRQSPAERSPYTYLFLYFSERARLAHPWPLKASHLGTASFHYWRSGPAFLRCLPSPFFGSVARSIIIPGPS